MILSGEKKEEYREIKPYYDQRFLKMMECNQPTKFFKVKFRNGYSKNSPSFVAEIALSINTGKEKWGAQAGKKYYVLTIIRTEILQYGEN
jgi:hypothetical protein